MELLAESKPYAEAATQGELRFAGLVKPSDAL
jgi:hypothetical protein